MSQYKSPAQPSTSDDAELIQDTDVKPVKRLLTPLLSKKIPPVPDETERKIFPLLKTNIFARIFFTWLIPLFNRGYRRTLDFNDLWRLDDRLSIKFTYPRFQRHLEEILTTETSEKSEKQKITKSSILKALFLTFKWEFIFSVFAATCNYGCQVVNPILVKNLINAVEKRVLIPDTSINDGIGYGLGIVVLLATSALMNNHALQNSKLVGAHARTILTKALLEKSFRANSETQHDFSNGKIFSLMSADLAKIDLGISYLPNVLSAPLPVIAALAVLIVYLGTASLSGIGVFFISITSFAIPGVLLMKYKKKATKYTDKRIELMGEVLNSMKIIKYHAWEDAYEEKIIEERTRESHYIFNCEWLTNMMFGTAFNLSLTSSMCTFLVYYAIHAKNGSSASIFASLALYNTLTLLISEFPMHLDNCSSGSISLDRICEYLEAPEKDENFGEKYGGTDESFAIKMEDCNFEWDNFDGNEKANEFGLKDINLDISKGEFVVITGPTGAGKSSLLHAMAGDVGKRSGSVSINGSSVFCDMPWIQSATIRENIVFGSNFDSAFYLKTVKACALEPDFDLWLEGDRTKVGERGVTLSGGQKARISLARAIYAQKDIYFFDDVLSALDAKVGQHIVKHCFFDLISHKTKILATHQLSLIYKADRIIFMRDDGTVDIRSGEGFMEINQHLSLSDNSEVANERKSATDEKEHFEESKVNEGEDGLLYGEEEKAVNAIPLNIYKQYIEAGSGIFSVLAIPAVIGITALTVFTTIFANVWLSFWIDMKYINRSDGFYIGLYVMFTFLALIFVISELVLIGYLTVNASRNLNIDAVKRLLHTTMNFIETTPSGRILNRFTEDTNSLDNEIGNQLKMFIHMFATFVGILVLCVIYLPWFAIAVPLLFIVFSVITNYYQASSREVKRLSALNRSHVYSNFNEVLNGMKTIKAYDSQRRFLEKNDQLVDRLNESYFVTVANQRWIGITLDLTGCGVALIITMLSLTRKFNLSAASTGLITTYVLDLATMLSETLTAYSEVENEMNSVERLCYYANNLDQEAEPRIEGSKSTEEWPQNGHIAFRNVSLRYREGLPLVIKGLTIDIKAKEKVGICGRTGAGKSSLISALYRLVEVAEGKIEIDGTNIRDVGLNDLRSKLSIMPQDLVLFKGTIRGNLDPFSERTDMELWDALRRSGLFSSDEMQSVIANNSEKFHRFHLDSVVESEGCNFSLGELQLLSLARTLTRGSKILIMDEATSNVDYETDSIVQATIAREFKNCTVLSIAHRLKTILHYDKILVLEKGQIAGYGEPLALYHSNELFREMCESSKITADDFKN